jgi:predicted unusual protein kinase regulating ubiquinone biosynthesis (AarF/ABC1/UbiB family)
VRDDDTGEDAPNPGLASAEPAEPSGLSELSEPTGDALPLAPTPSTRSAPRASSSRSSAGIPVRAMTRSAKIAALPIAAAGRATWGLGRRMGGAPAEMVAAELQARTAEQVFRVLGELKGGAMKFGQVMSIFEAVLPDEIAAPYRASLTKLQEAAPPMPTATVHRVLTEDFGDDWRDWFAEFDDQPAAAASIGQVHRARWWDGREVAVKIQYPGAGDALRADLVQISRLGRMVGSLVPGLDVRPLLAELEERIVEELDYRLEAQAQDAFARGFDGDVDFAVPHVVQGAEHVIVSEWLPGRPLSDIIAHGTQAERNHAGLLYVRFLFAGPARVGLLHADPHPGNYRLADGNRLGVLDYGAAARLPGGLPPSIGRLLRLAVDEEPDAVLDGLRAEGFVRPGVTVQAEELLDYLNPFVEPARVETFSFTREWMREQFNRVKDPRSPGYTVGWKLTLPPSYLLIHRTWLAGIGVLSQLGVDAPFRSELERWLPGFADGQAA